MPGLGRNPQPPERLVHLGHKGQHPRFDRTVIVVVKLLVLRRRRAEQRAAGLDQVRAGEIEIPIDQEILLLRADGGENLFNVGVSKELKNTHRLTADCFHGP
ncbi:hypothetical protein SDC9_151408 [bioreactor metagenome]|uniref:Uncharacterized protein n=1 Tax=bioreactor metagenome TaxID=1076179 RepID=A0A645ESA8_9ZZZZ